MQRSYWVCNDCGERFRNIRDLQREIETKKSAFKSNKSIKKLSIFMLILCILLFVIGWQFLLLTFFPIMYFSVLCIAIFFRVSKEIKEYESLIQELSYLKKHCIES